MSTPTDQSADAIEAILEPHQQPIGPFTASARKFFLASADGKRIAATRALILPKVGDCGIFGENGWFDALQIAGDRLHDWIHAAGAVAGGPD